MITKITGALNRVQDEEVRLQVGALEYQVLVPEFVRRQVQGKIGQELTLHTSEYLEGNPAHGRMVPRLIGFASEAELEFFDLFCTVDKIGVRKALKGLVRPIKEIADAIQRAEAALARAKETGDTERIERIEARLKQAREQARRNRGTDRNRDSQPQQEKPAAAPDASADVPRLVEEAYLRTVNRLPSDNERQIAAAYINDADEPIEGLRGLMWTLINTKEFIVNH